MSGHFKSYGNNSKLERKYEHQPKFSLFLTNYPRTWAFTIVFGCNITSLKFGNSSLLNKDHPQQWYRPNFNFMIRKMIASGLLGVSLQFYWIAELRMVEVKANEPSKRRNWNKYLWYNEEKKRCNLRVEKVSKYTSAQAVVY